MSLLYGVEERTTLDPRVGAIAPSTGIDILEATFDNVRLNFLGSSKSVAYKRAELEQARQYRDITGRDIGELMPPESLRQWQQEQGHTGTWTPEQRREVMRQKIAASGVEVDDVDVLAKQIVEASDERMMDVLGRAGIDTPTLIPGLAGGFGAAMTDPLNLASMLVGAGAGRTVLQTMLIEGAIGAGVELAQTPAISEWQSELGKKYGLSQMATSVLFAAGGGAAFGGLVRAPSAIWNKLKNEADGLRREAMEAVEAEELLNETQPAGVSREQHVANQQSMLERARLGARGHSEPLRHGDVTLDPKVDPLEVAIRTASVKAGDAVRIRTIARTARLAVRNQAEQSVKNLRGARLSPNERKALEKRVAKAAQRLGRSQRWWEEQARRSLEDKVRRGTRPDDFRVTQLDEFKMPAQKIVKPVLRAEADRLRARVEADRARAQAKLDGDAAATRAAEELHVLDSGKMPARLRPAYEKVRDELRHQAELRALHGDEGLARIMNQLAGDAERLVPRRRPHRKHEQVKEDLETRESPEYTGAMDAEVARMKDKHAGETLYDENGNVVDAGKYLDEADELDQKTIEAITTCGTGKA